MVLNKTMVSNNNTIDIMNKHLECSSKNDVRLLPPFLSLKWNKKKEIEKIIIKPLNTQSHIGKCNFSMIKFKLIFSLKKFNITPPLVQSSYVPFSGIYSLFSLAFFSAFSIFVILNRKIITGEKAIAITIYLINPQF
jgi:hypothetical protein